MKKKYPDVGRHVNISNALTRAAHGLTLAEKRLLMLAVGKLDAKKPPLPENMVVGVTAAEFAAQFGLSVDTAYDELQSAGRQLFNRYISFYREDGGGFTQMHWVGRADYQEREGRVELAFWHELAPQLFELGGLFTSYRLSRAAALRSIYSWRLFELLMQFKKSGWLKIPIEEFHHAVEAPDSCRKDFGALRRKCIEPAVKEIREKDGLAVTWEVDKAGRKVKALLFRFPVESQTTPSPPPVTEQVSRKRGRPKKNVLDDKPLSGKAREAAKAEATGQLQQLTNSAKFRQLIDIIDK